MEAERRENGLLSTSKRASTTVSVTCVDGAICIHVYPTSAEARVATAIGRIECLCRLGGGGRCADLDGAAREAVKERPLLRGVAACCADSVEHRAAHYYGRWSWQMGDLSACSHYYSMYLKLDQAGKSQARNVARAERSTCLQQALATQCQASRHPKSWHAHSTLWKRPTSCGAQIWT